MFLLWVFFCASIPAFSADLISPYNLESTAVLPSGVRSPRFLKFGWDTTERFGNDGQPQPLGQRLNRPVGWQDVLNSQPSDTHRVLLKSVLDQAGIPADTLAGATTGVVTSRVDVKAPVLSYGLSDRWTVALIAPIVSANVHVSTGFEASSEGQRFIDALCNRSVEKCVDATRNLNHAINSKLERLGYEPLQSRDATELGDLSLIQKYRLSNSAESDTTAKISITLPTGRTANPDRVIDTAPGDGRLKLAASLIYDRELGGGFRILTHAGPGLMLPHRIVKRLPTSEQDSLSADKEELVHELSWVASAGGLVSYLNPRVGFTLTAGYQSQYQTGAKYTGGNPDFLPRYSYLSSNEPEQWLHSWVSSIGFSTVDFYRRKEFLLPLQVNLVVSAPLWGRNVSTGTVVSGELVAFF